MALNTALARGHDHAGRAHHRGLGFLRRRRHPGRPEDLCRARRLRRLRDHGADRAEHPGVTGIHAVPPEFVTRADRCGVRRSRGRRGQDRHGGAAAVDRRDRREALKRWSPKQVVLDPVMVATSGDRLLAAEAVDALRQKLIPLATIITPNLPEAAALLNGPVAASEAAVEGQGRKLLAPGLPAVLIKGGHGEGGESIDYLVERERTSSRCRRRASRRKTPTAPAARCRRRSRRGWRKGTDLETAVRNAKNFISAAIAAADRFTRRPWPWADPSFPSVLLRWCNVPAHRLRWPSRDRKDHACA